jgi:DNA polymerase-3 subunit epsilon
MTLGQRSFEEMGTPLAEVPFCVFDLETTGLTPDTCEITEIGAAKYVGGVEIGRFQTLVNPGVEIPPTVTVVTGITHAMVVDAPRIEEALPSFLEFLGDSVIVGHNVRFDISFINADAIRLGYGRLPNRHADTLRLAQRLVRKEVRSMKLSSLASYFGSPVTPNHRALDDALATAHVFWSLLERAGSIGVTHLDDLLNLPTIKGARAIGKLSLTENLPRKPGVYTFRDRAGTPIYIGKATNLRSRVRSYFAGDKRKRIDNMLRDLHTIDYVETTSEIEAAVLENRAIAESKPLYNKRSKPPRSLHWLKLTDERFPRLSIAHSPGDGPLVLGPFRNRRSAEDVMHALWDATRIRRCTGRGKGCGYAQLGQAVCPCDGTVSDAEYAAIVHTLVEGVARPELLINSTRRRMLRLSEAQRYEDAALVRDRWGALTRAIHRQRVWRAFQDAGRVEAVEPGGACLEISHGQMVSVWRQEDTRALGLVAPSERSPHPASMVTSDEAMLLWKWIDSGSVQVASVSGIPVSPFQPIPELTSRRAHRESSSRTLIPLRSLQESVYDK